MRLVLAVIVAVVLFLFCWAFIAVLLTLLAWVVVQTEQASPLFFLIHVLLIWILSPGAGAALAIFATASIFKTVAPSAIFVSFVSVCAALFFVAAVMGAASVISGTLAAHNFVVGLFQILAIFIGARIGRFFAAGALVTAPLFSPIPAVAQTQQEMAWCENNGYAYSPDLQINGCTAVIQSGRLLGKGLASAFNNRGNAYNDKNDYDRAIADFDQAIRLDPKYAFAYDGRGNAHYSKNDKYRAFADFDKAIQFDPRFAGAYNDRGNVYYDQQEYDRAIADYDQAIRLDPEYAFAYNGRANAYNVKNDFDRAIADYDQAIRLDPKNPFTYNGRGGAYDGKEDYVHAIADYDQAIRLDPKYAHAHYGRGMAKLKSGDTAGGNADIATARQMTSN
jgi:tetratricopeptide (TPR) repeat protein